SDDAADAGGTLGALERKIQQVFVMRAMAEMEHVERIRQEEQRLSQHAVSFVTLSRVKRSHDDGKHGGDASQREG
ncbi:MAG: hypothetical protein WCK05_12800, partial [Planctomycetota bacterium]